RSAPFANKVWGLCLSGDCLAGALRAVFCPALSSRRHAPCGAVATAPWRARHSTEPFLGQSGRKALGKHVSLARRRTGRVQAGSAGRHLRRAETRRPYRTLADNFHRSSALDTAPPHSAAKADLPPMPDRDLDSMQALGSTSTG